MKIRSTKEKAVAPPISWPSAVRVMNVKTINPILTSQNGHLLKKVEKVRCPLRHQSRATNIRGKVAAADFEKPATTNVNKANQ